MNPQFPIYIPSKSRAKIGKTARWLETMGVPYRLVVEASQRDEYAAEHGDAKLLVLDPEFQRTYDTFDDLGDTKSKGPGPARNFIWEHARSEGHAWHWVMDDNIVGFFRLHENRRTPLGDGSCFAAMEDFVLRYRNIGMAGPNYFSFCPPHRRHAVYIPNTRIYSCNLIRNALPFRWRGRYNEDTDLSLRMLKASWATVQFNAFLQNKMVTQALKGGNTEAFYAAEGTLPKSKMLVAMHPDVCRLVWKFGRWHHHVDYKPFKRLKLIRRAAAPPLRGKYEFRLVDKLPRKGLTASP